MENDNKNIQCISVKIFKNLRGGHLIHAATIFWACVVLYSLIQSEPRNWENNQSHNKRTKDLILV